MKITKRQNQDGAARYWLDYHYEGRRRREVFPTKRAAETRLGEVSRDREEGRTLIPRRTPFKEYAGKCLSGYYGGMKSYAWAKVIMGTHLIPFFGERRLTAIRPSLVRDYQQRRLKVGVSNATVNREVSILSKIMSLAVKDDLLRENLVRRVDKLTEPDGRTFYLTADEAGKLLEACPPHVKRLVTVLLETGGRLGEVLALRWENVDFENHRIRFDSRTTKASRERFIPMTEEVEAVLREAHVQRLTSPAARECVFTYAGRRLRSARRAFYTAMERAGIPRPKGTGFHLTRHTAATWYMSTEGQKGKLQKILGHSSAKTTDRYIHTGAEYIETARQHLGRSAIIRRMASGHLGGHLKAKPQAR